jgi:hypothetical protein
VFCLVTLERVETDDDVDATDVADDVDDCRSIRLVAHLTKESIFVSTVDRSIGAPSDKRRLPTTMVVIFVSMVSGFFENV